MHDSIPIFIRSQAKKSFEILSFLSQKICEGDKGEQVNVMKGMKSGLEIF